MKGPKFNARVTQMNYQSDQNLARVLATFRHNISDEKYNMFSNVLRPCIHQINSFEVENADIAKVSEAIAATTAQMSLELMARTNPKGTPPDKLAKVVEGVIASFTDNLVHAVNQYFGTDFTSTTPAQPAPPPKALL